MKNKLFDSELKVMEILWKEGDLPAKEIAQILKEQIGWNKNTTYTVIKKCIAKEAIKRIEPNFLCQALVAKEEVQQQEASDFVNKLFNGSVDKLFASLVSQQNLSKEEISKLKKMIDELE